MLHYTPSPEFLSSLSRAMRGVLGDPLPAQQLSDERLEFVCRKLPPDLWRVKGYFSSCFAELRERDKIRAWF